MAVDACEGCVCSEILKPPCEHCEDHLDSNDEATCAAPLGGDS